MIRRAPARVRERSDILVWSWSGSVVVSISACHAEGRGFKSRPDRQWGNVAQLVEQTTENRWVGGSSPPVATTPTGQCSSAVEQPIRNR